MSQSPPPHTVASNTGHYGDALLPNSASAATVTGNSSSRSNSRSRGGVTAGTPTLSPRSSTIFAHRPSPVVPSPSCPASPALSRPTSPRPSGLGADHHHHHQQQPPVSPTRQSAGDGGLLLHHGHHGQQGGLSRTSSAVDLSHVFERDVEFASSHRISAQEAVDVAIAPVLDEAVVALSQPHTGYGSDLDVDLDNAGANPGSGWSSPVPSAAAAAAVASTSGASGAGAGGSLAQHLASRSPTRHAIGRGASTSQSRSFSPDSNGGRAGDRATSPGSATSTSFSIGTPPDHDAASQPFSQHLSEALEKERKAAATPGSVVLPPPVIATPSKLLAVAGEGVASPNPSIGSHGEFEAAGSVAAGTPSAGRRLSFISYADVINEERLAELTGAPVGGPEPHALAPGGTGGAVDLAGVLDRLELSFGSSGASHGTGTGGGTDETVVRS